MTRFTHEIEFPLGDFLPQPTGRTLSEPARDVPVLADCDVVVLGGGPAGACAAAAAGRCGASVVLVERHGFLGGVATAGGVTLWHSLYGTDGRTKVIGGLPEEIIRRLAHMGATRNQAEDGETGPWAFCSHHARWVLDDLAMSSGVKMLLHAQFCGVLADAGRVSAAIVETKSGRGAITAKVFIDATGDADLVRMAGAGTQFGDGRGHCQPPGMVMRLAGRQENATPAGEIQARVFQEPMDYNGQRYPAFLWGAQGVWDRSEMMLSAARVPGINTADGLDLTRAEIEARYQLRWLLGKIKQTPGWEACHMLEIAPQIGPRESHRIVAEHQLRREEVLEGTPFADAVAQGTYPIDIHTPDKPGITFEYLNGRRRRVAGDRTTTFDRWDGQGEDAPLRETLCYQVPYRSLIPRDLANVLAAGRCSGIEHDAAGAIRVMINCMQLGQAAGTAAAIGSRAGAGDVRTVPADELRRQLLADGVPLLQRE